MGAPARLLPSARPVEASHSDDLAAQRVGRSPYVPMRQCVTVAEARRACVSGPASQNGHVADRQHAKSSVGRRMRRSAKIRVDDPQHACRGHNLWVREMLQREREDFMLPIGNMPAPVSNMARLARGGEPAPVRRAIRGVWRTVARRPTVAGAARRVMAHSCESISPYITALSCRAISPTHRHPARARGTGRSGLPPWRTRGRHCRAAHTGRGHEQADRQRWQAEGGTERGGTREAPRLRRLRAQHHGRQRVWRARCSLTRLMKTSVARAPSCFWSSRA